MGQILQVSASDPEGQPVTYAIAGGSDASKLTISSSGALSFVSTPSFEQPSDADANNTYAVRISASDGTNTSFLDLVVTVTGKGGDFRVRQISRVSQNPFRMAADPTSRRFIVLTENEIWSVDGASGTNVRLSSRRVSFTANTSCTDFYVQSIAFSPTFASDGRIYLGGYACTRGDLEIRRAALSSTGAFVLPFGPPLLHSRVNAISFSPEADTIDMRFGPDGLLYFATGDQSVNFGRTPGPSSNGFSRDLFNLAGKVNRIDVNGDDFPADPNRNYRIPAGNAFPSGGGAPEIYVYGFHIPQGLDFRGPDLLLADRGFYDPDLAPTPVHEIDFIRPADKGGDFGFSNCQGERNFQGTGPCTFPTILPLVYFRDPMQATGRYIIGGIVYEGPIASLRGSYLFGFGSSGRSTSQFWSISTDRFAQNANIEMTTLRNRTSELQPIGGGEINSLTAIGEDSQGNAYFFDFDGDIFVIEPIS